MAEETQESTEGASWQDELKQYEWVVCNIASRETLCQFGCSVRTRIGNHPVCIVFMGWVRVDIARKNVLRRATDAEVSAYNKLQEEMAIKYETAIRGAAKTLVSAMFDTDSKT